MNQYGPGAVGVGWDMALLALARHIASGESVDSKEGVAWLSSAEGNQFVRLSGGDWCRAAIAAGDEAEKAKASAERTRAAYTGEPETPKEP